MKTPEEAREFWARGPTDMKTEDVNEFWAEVAKMGWNKKGDFHRIEKMLLKTWTVKQAARMRTVFDGLMSQLYKKLDKHVDGVGDDSFSDLRAHIIGLGKAEFDRVMEDPSLAQKRINANDFIESFAYALPYEESFESIDPLTYVDRAKEIVTELTEGLKDDRFEPVFPQMKELIAMFERAAVDPKSVLPLEKEALALRKAIEKRGDWLWRDSYVRDGAHFANSAAISNFFGDVRNYLA